jgi:phasin family protein
MPAQKTSHTSDFSNIFTSFPVSGFPADHFVAAHRRNFEAVTAAAQVTVDSLQAVFRRQVEIFTQMASEGPDGLRSLWAPAAPEEKLAQQADFVKSTFEKGITNFRELSDMLVKSNAEATDLLTKRVTEGFAELKDATAKA